MQKRFVLFIIVTVILLSASAQVKWPVVTNQTKPWTRWWWEGNAVTKPGLTWNLGQYNKAGIGGVEITPIYGIYGYEKQFVDFLSPQWMQLLQHTLNEAKRFDIGVDIANGTGWPFGGPWVTDSDASKTIYYKTYSLNGGEQLNEAIQYDRPQMVRVANNKPVNADTLAKPVAKNKNLQALALDQVQYAGKLPLQAVVAYSADGKTIALTKHVDANGKLNWTAPAGQWKLYALFEGLHGKMVERAAPGGEGYAIDHFSATAARNYFKRFDQAFKGFDLSYVRALFNDSYEVDDARGQANWTPQFLSEFRKRKGYDLQDHLPALFKETDSITSSRVIYDYRSVIDELLLENFTMEWKKWGTSKGMLLRNQSHGSPANTLDLYDVVAIPETEGTDILRFKFATSAANVGGKKLVSAESATWLNEHFLSSWGDVKKAIDLYFLGGVNHIVYHGTAYSPQEAIWPGWLFYAAVHFQPVNPQWKDFHSLNTYITRVQSFLQQGQPDNDVLLYYPIVDRYSEPGPVLLQHFDGMERNFEKTDFEHVSKEMLDKGYGFDFFSDRQLQQFNVSTNAIISHNNRYRAILLPANKLIPEASFQKLVALARQGATILVYKSLPQDVPGWGQLDKRRKTLEQLVANLRFVSAGNTSKATVGTGAFFVSDDLEALLRAGRARKESLATEGLSVLRRKNANGFMYFVNNRTQNDYNGWIELSEQSSRIALFDAMTGKSGLARQRMNSNGRREILLQIAPHESVIVQVYKGNPAWTHTTFPYAETTGEAIAITGEWSIEFLDGGPVLPKKLATASLRSWTELAGDEGKNFSGTARYSIQFGKPGVNASGWLLDLGKVHETAEVFVNGKKISTLVGPTFRTVIPSSVLQQTNRLDIVVANLMANRIAYMDRHNLPWKIFYNTNMPARRRENVKNGLFDASAWKPLLSGLSGPVTITAIK